jgi:hypothetical protein
MRRTFALLLSALAALAVASGSFAQGTAPAPGCAGEAYTDETGDVFPAAGGPAATNLDIVKGWFNTDAKGVVTANLQVDNMSLTPTPPATAVTWYQVWTVGEAVFYVALESDLTGATVYDWGQYVVDEAAGTATYTPSGETTGSVVEGANGVVSIVVPKGAKGAVGQKLTQPNGQTAPLVQNGLGGGVLLPGDDTLPEDGKTYDVGACELGTGGGSTPAPAPATPAPGGGGAPTPAAAPGGTAAPKLPLKLVTKSVKSKKGTLAVKLKASEAVTGIGARVRKGTKALGTGKLAKLAKGKTGTVKVKAKKAKKGSYTLDVTARLADGRLASGSFKLKVK